jgi:hypothetical protein
MTFGGGGVTEVGGTCIKPSVALAGAASAPSRQALMVLKANWTLRRMESYLKNDQG